MTEINWKRGLFRLKLLCSLTCLLILLITIAIQYKDFTLHLLGWKHTRSGKWTHSYGTAPKYTDDKWYTSDLFSHTIRLAIIGLTPWILHPFIAWAIKGFHHKQ